VHYVEWIVYCGLVLPQAVFSAAPCLELFGSVVGELLVVDLTRGHSVNVHQELDRLKEWFPAGNAITVTSSPMDTFSLVGCIHTRILDCNRYRIVTANCSLAVSAMMPTQISHIEFTVRWC
jgi:hypothetical protein